MVLWASTSAGRSRMPCSPSTGVLVTAKAPTTPDDQSRGVLDAVAAVLRARRRAPRDVDAFAHGMTVATNALLEGRARAHGARRDRGLHRRRRARPPGARRPLPPVRGAPGAARPARAALRRAGARWCPTASLRPLDRRAAPPRSPTPSPASRPRRSPSACCTPTRDPHTSWRSGRRAATSALADGVHVSLSHEVVGTFREYERAATTEIDAALSPLLAALPAAGSPSARAPTGLPEPAIMQSSGGLADAADRGRAHAALDGALRARPAARPPRR